MNYRQYYLTKNDCYKRGDKIYIKGLMLHSTGAANKNVKRYASDGGWNRPDVEKCVHGFIGLDEDWNGVGFVQTLPWSMKGWHAGKGNKGSANSGYIGIEVCEDQLKDENYLMECVEVAATIFAYLCKKFNLDPKRDGVIISHSEGYRRGIASNHGDIDHWFKKFGYSMDKFREKVYNIYVGKDEPTMTQEKFNEMCENWLNSRASREPSPWADAIGLLDWITKTEVTTSTKGMQKLLTKEEVLAIVKKALELS